jgi:hypothetical protein
LNTITTAAQTGQNSNLYFFLAGSDRANFGLSSSSVNLDNTIRRASVSLFTEARTFYVQQPKVYSVFTSRPPESSLTINFYSTHGSTVTPSSVTLTPTAPNAAVTLVANYPISGRIGMLFSGPDAHNYADASSVAFNPAVRNAIVQRVCTYAETQLQSPPCSVPNSFLSNYDLNAPDVFLTYFNITVPAPTVNGLTIYASNPNLQITPNPIVIAAGQTTAQFSVGTSVGGSHEVFWSYDGGFPDSFIHSLPTSTIPGPVSFNQPRVGRTGVAFPTAAAVQNVVPFALIASLALLLIALF